MDNAQIFSRYQTLQRYVGWCDADAVRVRAAGQVVHKTLPALVDDFYEEIERHPQARQVITGGEAQVARLKTTLLAWVEQLFAGKYDAEYVCRRWRVGLKHVEIGLEQVYTNVALSRVRTGLLCALCQDWNGTPEELVNTLQSLHKLLDLDLAIIEDAYHAEYLARRKQEEQARRSERLSAIGEMIAGLAHESRNALQRIGASAELLETEVEQLPEALELVRRILKSQEHLHRLFDEVRTYAAPVQLDLDVHNLSGIWREAWELLESQRRGRVSRLVETVGHVDLHCRADRFRLSQVFRNVLENALAACEDPVEIKISCRDTELSTVPALEIRVRDNGPGMNAEQRERIFQPFYTTKAKGTGLGMSIAQRIVEAHGGQITVADDEPDGAVIVVTLPR